MHAQGFLSDLISVTCISQQHTLPLDPASNNVQMGLDPGSSKMQ